MTLHVLLPQLEDGCHANDLEGLQARNIDPETVTRALSECFCRQMFQLGFVHCGKARAGCVARVVESPS